MAARAYTIRSKGQAGVEVSGCRRSIVAFESKLRAKMGGSINSGAMYHECGPVHKNATVDRGIRKEERWRIQTQKRTGKLNAGSFEFGVAVESTDTGYLESRLRAQL
jgi:hypothetical protein